MWYYVCPSFSILKDRFSYFRAGFFVLYNFYDMRIRIMIRHLHNDDKIRCCIWVCNWVT